MAIEQAGSRLRCPPDFGPETGWFSSILGRDREIRGFTEPVLGDLP